MRNLPSCLLYSGDQELVNRLSRISDRIVTAHPVSEQDELLQHLSQFGDTLLIADLRAPNCLELLSTIKADWSMSVIIALGVPHSDPMLYAEWLDLFATIDTEPDRREFQMMLKHAVECHRLRQKSHELERELTSLNARQSAPKTEPRNPLAGPLHNFSRAQRNFDNLEKLFESVVDGLVDTARVSRAGIFIRAESDDDYVFRAGMRCLSLTRTMSFKHTDPFVQWLESHVHLVARQTLNNIDNPNERTMLKQALDALGAEVIIPLHIEGLLKGWIFIGRRVTGIPFEIADLEDLTGLADHISTTLEKALKYKETALQKTLAETVLHSIPFGIVACDENAIIRWFNSAARDILKPIATTVIGQPVETLGSQVADLMHRVFDKDEGSRTSEWTDPRMKRTLSAKTQSLSDGGSCVGAMMMLHDITGVKLLQEKEEQLERATFWTDLAASMSHEIRNPLVAIKTFAQLLPDRYEDPEFRAEFGEQVTAEVDKLNQIVDKINGFADLPNLVCQPLDIRRPIENAVTRLQAELGHENLKIHLAADDSPLQINGDTVCMEECFYHLLRNAAENLDNRKSACIKLSVKSRAPDNAPASVCVLIADNGSGIDESVRDKLFSPFSTTKARGLGLGLPIAKRAVVDHNGQLDIESGKNGTTLIITLPALSGNPEPPETF